MGGTKLIVWLKEPHSLENVMNVSFSSSSSSIASSAPSPTSNKERNKVKVLQQGDSCQPREVRVEEEVRRRWAVNARLLVLLLVLFCSVAPSARVAKTSGLFVGIND